MADFKTLLAIGDLMNKQIVLISKDSAVQGGAVMMTEENAGSLLVMDGDTLVGIVTEQDIVRRAVAKRLDVTTTPIAEIMTGDPLRISHDESIFEARNLIKEKGVNHLVVVEGEKPVGILTSANLLGG